jgi:SAM-dependent methyltransferase
MWVKIPRGLSGKIGSECLGAKIANAVIEAIFNQPFVYRSWGFVVSSNKGRKTLLNELALTNQNSVLDFGCGFALQADAFLGDYYLGIDPLEKFCKLAERRLKHRAECNFIVGDENTLARLESLQFDLVFGIGVLHHMKDEQVRTLSIQAHRILKDGGRVMFWEPNIDADTSWHKRKVMQMDRGQNVRSIEEYINSLGHENWNFEAKLHKRLLRIPYDITTIHCRKK